MSCQTFSDKRFHRSVRSDGSLRYVSREMRADPSESGRTSSGTADFMIGSVRSFSKTRNLLYLSLWVSTLGIPFFSFEFLANRFPPGVASRCIAVFSTPRKMKQSRNLRLLWNDETRGNDKTINDLSVAFRATDLQIINTRNTVLLLTFSV